ncbi:MAG: aminotransferase class III-fold pyridoxal phosphate-dependent enzyme [Acidimicrobiaceae bacterium]|nr:aminotransferase class III-fold pyridoxal phosphate-dependent enzyme [Acidimicrobiaceae bacterium]MCY4176793.1 aminotransferase class III-fold pyridoxal phosphate-dependent enzyme [Acidimicrobiaceae bacterium]MCY4280986.1 aminotransferase class III-fold pyridoxal phosphate-dependent enzyme [Acidimicrobiaceae bacterium]MCY4295182.1 aminotransferase class III-fold pyridoxal phosphate-dependent enzyme [Acidimicrobiaceae bacterium]
MASNAELARRYAEALPSFLRPLYRDPVSIDRGEGGYVWDVEGARYLDFFGGVLTTMIGHAEPSVVAAVQQQAAKVMHTSTLYLNEPMIAFAEEVARVSGIDDARVFFLPSGSEANDAALLLATVYRGSNQILAMRNSYHGRTFSTQAITAQRSWSSTSHSGLNITYVHGGYRLRSPFRHLDDDAYTSACVDDLVQLIDMTTAGDVAAMIAEPIQGVGGFTVPPDGFFGAMGKVLSAHGILFISDEVQTGWGRTGEHFWGYEAHGIVPDLLTFAKGVGNGITLAGVVARAEIFDRINALQFSTFGGNPLSVAAGRATLAKVLADDLQGNALVMGRRLADALAPAVERYDWVAEMRGRGLMLALEFVHPGSVEPDLARSAAVLEGCKERGLLIGRGGLYGNVVRITPMLNVTADEIDEGAEALLGALAAADV